MTEDELKKAQQTQYDIFYRLILETQGKDDDIDGKKLTERFPLLQTIFERYYVSAWDLEKFETEYETNTTNPYRKPYTLEPKYDK